jgi:hypothetical protein
MALALISARGFFSAGHAAMASAMRLVALILDAMISALMAGDQRVLMGSPARFTTPSHPTIAADHRDGSANAMVPLEKELRSAARAFSTSRVSTTTSLPPASSFATRRVPTKPLAPEIATRIFPEEEEEADAEEEEGAPEEASPARATCARPRRAAGGRAARDAQEARDDSEDAATCRPVAERESSPRASVADTPRSRRARGASAIVRAATRDRASRAEPRATHGAIERDATGTEVICFVPSGPGRGSPRASGGHTRRACRYDHARGSLSRSRSACRSGSEMPGRKSVSVTPERES